MSNVIIIQFTNYTSIFKAGIGIPELIIPKGQASFRTSKLNASGVAQQDDLIVVIYDGKEIPLRALTDVITIKNTPTSSGVVFSSPSGTTAGKLLDLKIKLDEVFPKSSYTNSILNSDELFKLESNLWDGRQDVIDGFNGSYADGTPSISINTLVKTLYQIVPTGWTARVYSISLSCMAQCRFTGYIASSQVPSDRSQLTSLINVYFGTNGGNQTISFGADGITLFELGRIQLDVYSRSTTYPQPQIFIAGKLIANDTNFDAKYVIGSIGDSISHPGTIGSTSNVQYGETHFLPRIASSLKSSGFNLRKRYMGFNAATSVDIVSEIKSGKLDRGVIPNLCIINLFINDAISIGAAVTTTAVGSSRYNAEYIIDWLFSRNPNMSIIVNGPTTSDKTGVTTNGAGYRTMLSGIVDGSLNSNKYAAKVASNQLKYYDASTGLSATDANFVETGAGNHLHPNGNNGHLIIYNGLWPVVQSTKFYTDGN